MITLNKRNQATINNPDADQKTLFLDADGNLKLKDEDGNVGFVTVTDTLPAPQPKVYRALLTQSGTDAPVATVLENTLGGEIVWTRYTVGYYIGTLINAFPYGKTILSFNNIGWEDVFSNIFTRTDDDAVRLIINGGEGGVLNTTNPCAIEILVYP